VSYRGGRLTETGRRIIIEGVLSGGLWPTRPRKGKSPGPVPTAGSATTGPTVRVVLPIGSPLPKSSPHHWLSPTRCEVAPLP
jgi:hypothetical protein